MTIFRCRGSASLSCGSTIMFPLLIFVQLSCRTKIFFTRTYIIGRVHSIAAYYLHTLFYRIALNTAEQLLPSTADMPERLATYKSKCCEVAVLRTCFA